MTGSTWLIFGLFVGIVLGLTGFEYLNAMLDHFKTYHDDGFGVVRTGVLLVKCSQFCLQFGTRLYQRWKIISVIAPSTFRLCTRTRDRLSSPKVPWIPSSTAGILVMEMLINFSVTLAAKMALPRFDIVLEFAH